MEIQVNNLQRAYNSFRELCENYSLDQIGFFRNGNKLLPRNKKGSKIHIKEKNEGKFTASAKAAGQSVQEHASSVLNDPNATTLQKKRANFARNAKAWSKNK